MNRSECFHGFQFNDEHILDKNVCCARTDQTTFVLDSDITLAPEDDVPYPQFYTERFFVERFQIAGAEHAMHLDRCTNDPMNAPL